MRVCEGERETGRERESASEFPCWCRWNQIESVCVCVCVCVCKSESEREKESKKECARALAFVPLPSQLSLAGASTDGRNRIIQTRQQGQLARPYAEAFRDTSRIRNRRPPP